MRGVRPLLFPRVKLMQPPSNAPQKQSASYRLAEVDKDFLFSDSMRGVRLLLEFTKADERLCEWGVRSTVVVFGSARRGDTLPKQALARHQHHCEQARHFGRIVSERGGALTPVDGARHNVIATGGGPGIMEAANRGAYEAGAPSIGFNIHLAHEQEPNPYTTPELTFQFGYFGIRKMHLVMRAAALVVFPGGLGTLDELFEMLTLVQTHKTPVIPILCFDEAYWRKVVNFDALRNEGMIGPADLDALKFAEDAETAWETLKASGLHVPG